MTQKRPHGEHAQAAAQETKANLSACRRRYAGITPNLDGSKADAQQLDQNSAVFILFSWNFDLFWTSLQTYVAAGWGPRLIIIDNSKDRKVLSDPKVCKPASGGHASIAEGLQAILKSLQGL